MTPLAPLTLLPAPLDRWVDELLGQAPPAEQQARCPQCVMCDGDRGRAGGAPGPMPQRIVFDPVARCCTYQPHIPNYLAGAVLGSTDEATAHGRATLRERMARGHATLLGVRVDPVYQLIYREANAPAFGRARALRCPHHLDNSDCGLWSHRPAVCATWLCKFERGAVGGRQWQALHQVLKAAERVVALSCLRRLGVPAAACQAVLAQLDDGSPLDATALDQQADPAQREAWGTWWGREAEFYRACHEQVQGMGWAEVLAEGGADLALLAHAACVAARVHAASELPARVQLGTFQVRGQAQGRVWLQGHSEFDPLAVGLDVMALLARCDGRAWDEIADEQAALGCPRPSRWLLRTLLDHGLLRPA